MYEQIWSCKIARATIWLERLLVWIRKNRVGPEIDLFGTSEPEMLKIKRCPLDLSLLMVKLYITSDLE